MITNDSIESNALNTVDNVENALQVIESSSDSGSEISLSEKIILESNEKRLRQRMTSLQNSLENLKEQLKMEKELWKEDMEQIRILKQQQEMKCSCLCKLKEYPKIDMLSACNSICTLGGGESLASRKYEELVKNYTIKQMLEYQNYKRKLAETENMCNLELSRVKQSLEDLKTLKNIATEWGKNDDKSDNSIKSTSSETQTNIQEIYITQTNE